MSPIASLFRPLEKNREDYVLNGSMNSSSGGGIIIKRHYK